MNKTNNRKHSIAALLLALIMVLSLVPTTAFAAEIVDSGTCGAEGDGSNLTWTLDHAGKLTISGTGTMESFSSKERMKRMEDYSPAEEDRGYITTAPWGVYCDQISSVSIEKGVTTIGSSAFKGCDYLASVVIPDGMISVGGRAFEGCNTLTNLIIPDSVETIGTHAFSNCSSLQCVTIGSGVKKSGIMYFLFAQNLKELIIAQRI